MKYEDLIGSIVTAASRTAEVAVGEVKGVIRNVRGAVTRLLVETADKTIVKVSTIRHKIDPKIDPPIEPKEASKSEKESKPKS